MHYQDFHLKPSRQFIILIIAFSLGGVGACLSLPMGIKWLFAFTSCIYGAWLLWRLGLLKSRYAIVYLRCYVDGGWKIRQSQQMLQDAVLLGDSVVTTWVSVLRFLVDGHCTVSCVVFHDALGKHTYRQLTVQARFCA